MKILNENGDTTIEEKKECERCGINSENRLIYDLTTINAGFLCGDCGMIKFFSFLKKVIEEADEKNLIISDLKTQIAKIKLDDKLDLFKELEKTTELYKGMLKSQQTDFEKELKKQKKQIKKLKKV